MSSVEAPIEPPAPISGDASRIISFIQDQTERSSTHVARVLHDELGGLLVSAVMDAALVEQSLPEADPVRERLTRIRATLASAIDLKRNLIEQLRPSLLDNFGLFAAFRWHVKELCKSAEAKCTEHYPEEEVDLKPGALTELFRIMQDTLAVTLAEPALRSIDVNVAVEDGNLRMKIGHTHAIQETLDMVQHAAERMGAVACRIERIGGRVSLHRHETGTDFTAWVPLQHVVSSPA
jgi:signal transduction histidine kinase